MNPQEEKKNSLMDRIGSIFTKEEEVEEDDSFYGKDDMGIEQGTLHEHVRHKMDLWEIGVIVVEVILVIYTLLVLMGILPFF